MKSLDQRRAAAAYRTMEGEGEETLRMARKLPAMLQINGLLASWAFLLAKERDDIGARTILGALLSHMGNPPDGLGLIDDDNGTEAFLRWVGGGRGADEGIGGTELRNLTAEALAFAGWLKRAAEAQGDEEGGMSDAPT